MTLLKKQGPGTWISLVALLTAVIALILYGTAVSAGTGLQIASGSDLFYEAIRPEDSAMMSTVVTCGVLGLVSLVLAVVLGQFQLNGTMGKVCDIVVGVLRIVVPVFLIAALLYFAYGSFTGLGWTFFSNAELEIYAEATAVGTQVITGIVFFAISAVAGIVAAFFSITKKNAD